VSDAELQDYRLKQLDKLWTDVYFGSGKDDPSIISRLEKTENNMDDVRKYLGWITATVVMTFLAVMGWMATQIVQGFHH